MTLKIAYKANGRTGNNLFQYFTCKILGYIFGHQYEENPNRNIGEWITLTDDIFAALSVAINPEEDPTFKDLRMKNIWCDGYFQNSSLFVKWRSKLLEDIEHSHDKLPDANCGTRSIYDFMRVNHNYNFTNRDLIISLRLDDFYQAPCPTSDIIPPEFYISLLNDLDFDKLYIIVDRIRHSWEHAYLRRFDKWMPTIISGSLEHDAAVMRSAPRLIHSNSTLCWLSSFMSNKKERYIPRTNFYKMQKLGLIDELTDKIFDIKPLPHKDVHLLTKLEV